MSARSEILAPLALVALLSGLSGLLAGCGGDGSPADRVPALQTRLDAVDRAVEAHDYTAARSAADRLVHSAFRSERSGDLDHAEAAAIASAAERLVAALPGGQEQPSPEPAPTTPSPTDASPSPPPPGHEPKEPKDDKGHGEPKPGKGPKDHAHGKKEEH